MTDVPVNGSRAALLARPVQIWLLFTVVAFASGGLFWLGGIAYAQAKEDAADAKAATEKAETRLVDSLKAKAAADAALAAELAKKLAKQEAKQDAADERRHDMDRKMDLLILLLDGESLAKKLKLPKADDHEPAKVKPP